MSHVIQPHCLTVDDTIYVVAPSGPVQPAELISGMSQLPFPSRIGSHVLDEYGFFAGPKTARLADFQAALDIKGPTAILCARGGFGVSELIDDLSFEEMIKEPKWIIGSSDITALLVHLWANFKLQTIHGPMGCSLQKLPNDDIRRLCNLLTASQLPERMQLHPMYKGSATGPLLGGNLTILAHLIGSFPVECFKGALLFLEDVTEAPYRIERCLIQLKRCGLLQQISGVVLGEFTKCESGKDGVTVETVLRRNLEPLNVPIASAYPAAHGLRNYAFIHGRLMSLQVSEKSAMLFTP